MHDSTLIHYISLKSGNICVPGVIPEFNVILLEKIFLLPCLGSPLRLFILREQVFLFRCLGAHSKNYFRLKKKRLKKCSCLKKVNSNDFLIDFCKQVLPRFWFLDKNTVPLEFLKGFWNFFFLSFFIFPFTLFLFLSPLPRKARVLINI